MISVVKMLGDVVPASISKRIQTKWQNLLSRSKSDDEFNILLYPPFEAEKDLGNYLGRLSWYIRTEKNQKPINIFAFSECIDVDGRLPASDEMVHRPHQFSFKMLGGLASIPNEARHIDVVLNWDSAQRTTLNRLRKEYDFLHSVPVENIDVLDPESHEYGVWASFSWRRLCAQKFRDELVKESFAKLMKISSILKKHSSFSLVLGTGPSFEEYKDFDLKGGVVIACNSAVEDSDFFQGGMPDILCFGDAAHHIGPSKKAEQFRKSLAARLVDNPDFFVITTAKYAPILLEEFKDHVERFIFLEQSGKREPNFQIARTPHFPALDSVTNIYMLPIASHLSDRIFLLGLDGMDPQNRTEDFWNHNSQFNYTENLAEFHKVHPTFDFNRRRPVRGLPPTEQRYEEDLLHTFEKGEKFFGKQFVSLSDSFSKPVKQRFSSEEIDIMLKGGGLLRHFRIRHPF